MHRAFVPAILVLTATTVLLHGAESGPDRVPILARWYQSVGRPLPGERFGVFLGRVGRSRLGAPYREAAGADASPSLQVELEEFECVSFLESSLALARCAWRGDSTHRCFVWETIGLRYRGGITSGYASRLHYFVDWLEDNEGRWRLRVLTGELGGRAVGRDFFYLSGHASRIPLLASPGARRSMRAVEADLSSRRYFVLERQDVRRSLDALQDGDLVAVVGDKPGRLITHAGLVVRQGGGEPRLLHASSYHRRVVMTRNDLADYVTRRPERRGILVARPLPPHTNQ